MTLNKMPLRCLLLVASSSLATLAATAELRLPAVLSDHAMMQAGRPIAVWGWAEPGSRVRVVFLGSGSTALAHVQLTTDSSGKWSGQLAPLKDGTTGRIEVTTDKHEQKVVNDILVGEVWLASGQSNMVYPISPGPNDGFLNKSDPEEMAQVKQNIARARAEADATKPPVRFFIVAESKLDKPADDVKGSWVVANSANIDKVSAVAWNFAITVEDKVHLPVGLIQSCISGSPIEAWMSKAALESTSVGAAVEQRHAEAAAATPGAIATFNADMAAWTAANPTPELQRLHLASRPKQLWTTTSWQTASGFYNGMIAGLEPYTLRGILWYQADGNSHYPLEYSEMFQAMIKEWRSEWHEPLPFYFVEMNNMNEDVQTRPVQPTALSLIREQQHGGLALPGVGMVAAIDLGIKNAHFPNKRPVGQRLAGLALRDCYGIPGQVNSPMFKSATFSGDKARLNFKDAADLRVRGGGEIKGFAIRGESGPWVRAEGKIEGETIVVWSDQVPHPVAVRYGWASNPVISIENGAGLPLYPFRTDTSSRE
jgi:sialate O-acetylesterase